MMKSPVLLVLLLPALLPPVEVRASERITEAGLIADAYQQGDVGHARDLAERFLRREEESLARYRERPELPPNAPDTSVWMVRSMAVDHRATANRILGLCVTIAINECSQDGAFLPRVEEAIDTALAAGGEVDPAEDNAGTARRFALWAGHAARELIAARSPFVERAELEATLRKYAVPLRRVEVEDVDQALARNFSTCERLPGRSGSTR